MRLRSLAVLTGLLLCLGPAVSRVSAQPVVKILAFSGDGLNSSELATLERLVSAYVVELSMVRVIGDDGLELLASAGGSDGAGEGHSLLDPDFLLRGSVGRLGDQHVLSLEITRLSSGEQLVVADSAASVNDLVLRLRALTHRLFGRGETEDSNSLPGPEAALAYRQEVRAADLVGTWRGDRNIESIRLFNDGSGVAVLSAGGTLRLRYSIDGSLVSIVQNQANDPRMFRTDQIGHNLALEIAARARPLRWEFRLSADGGRLFGIKHGIAVSGTATAIEVDNEYSTEMFWIKVGR